MPAIPALVSTRSGSTGIESSRIGIPLLFLIFLLHSPGEIKINSMSFFFSLTGFDLL